MQATQMTVASRASEPRRYRLRTFSKAESIYPANGLSEVLQGFVPVPSTVLER